MARKIENLMNAAIASGKDWRQDNTEVRNENNVARVFLHGNLIAEVYENSLTLYDGGWRTATTKSRLNAILRENSTGEVVYQKNHQWFIATENGDVPFFSGFRLV